MSVEAKIKVIAVNYWSSPNIHNSYYHLLCFVKALVASYIKNLSEHNKTK